MGEYPRGGGMSRGTHPSRHETCRGEGTHTFGYWRHQNTYGWQSGGAHPTGVLSCFTDVFTYVTSIAITSYGRAPPGLDVVQSRTTVHAKTSTASKTVTLRASRSAGTRLVPTTSATRSSRNRRRNRSVSWTAPRTASWRSSVRGRAVTRVPCSTRLKYTSLRPSYIKIHQFFLGSIHTCDLLGVNYLLNNRLNCTKRVHSHLLFRQLLQILKSSVVGWNNFLTLLQLKSSRNISCRINLGCE